MKLGFVSLVLSLFVVLSTYGVSGEDCLSTKQQHDLESSVTAIHNILTVTANTLDNFANNEHNKDTQKALNEASRVVKIVDQYLCGNISKIANEACGSCSEIIKAARDAVNVLEDTMLAIEPQWRDNTIYKEVAIGIDALISIAQDLCPKTIVTELAKESSCLTPRQASDLEEAVKVMKTVLGSALAALDVAIAAEKDEKVKSDLILSRKIILSICKDIVEKLVSIGNEACGTCDGIVRTISDSVVAIEEAIKDINPEWADSPIYKDLVTGIASVLEIATNSCPSYYLFIRANGESCLSPQQDKELIDVVKHLDKLFDIVVVSLGVAAASVEDEKVKRQLQESAKILNAIQKEIIRKDLVKLTREASCGTCEDIVKTIEDAVTGIEVIISQAVPEWNSNALYQAITAAISEVLSLAGQFCTDDQQVIADKVDVAPLVEAESKNCLTPDEEATLKIVVKRLDELFAGAAVALRAAAEIVPNDNEKKELALAAKVVDAIDQDIIQKKLVGLVEEGSCGTCEDIVQTTKDAIAALESVLTQVEPDWETNPVYEGIKDLIDYILPHLEAACKKTHTESFLRVEGEVQF